MAEIDPWNVNFNFSLLEQQLMLEWPTAQLDQHIYLPDAHVRITFASREEAIDFHLRHHQ